MKILLASLLLLSGCGSLPVASPEFAEFLNSRRSTAAPAPEEIVRRGREVFLRRSCAMCHTVRGTGAFGRVGPDLTHVASRSTLAAGTMPNTRGHLAGWILNPQNLKPGTQMPPTLLTSEDFHALLAYVESLK